MEIGKANRIKKKVKKSVEFNDITPYIIGVI